MIVLIAVLLSALLGFSALAVDTSILYMQDAQLQTAVDAGVLAGASALPDTFKAANLCRQYILENCEGAENISISFEGGDMVINATAELSSEALFSRIFGNDSLDGRASASAQKTKGGLGGPFNYRLFTGDKDSKIQLGATFYIDGDIHSNGSVSISPASGTVTGRVEGRTTVYVNKWTAKVGAEVPGADIIDMVDFSGVLDKVLPKYYPRIEPASTFNAPSGMQHIVGDIYVNGDVKIKNQCTITGNLYVNGNVTMSGGTPVCVIKGSLYATGNIMFGNGIQVEGSVIAGGNIVCTGNMTAVNNNAEVCIYSENGDISMNAAGNVMHGIIYAPNGAVKIASGGTTYYGSIIGKTFSGIPAGLNILPPEKEFSFMPEGKPKVSLIR